MTRKVTIIGVLMDLGADRRGVDMGPSAVRVAALNERLAALGSSCIARSQTRTIPS